MRKYASATLYAPRIAQPGDERRRTAHRVEFDYTPRPGYLYVRSRMISSRCNDNYDEFSAEEIKGNGRTTGYKTFVGKPVFVNHNNDDHRRARGVIIDARLHEDRNPDGSPDTWVEGLMEVDAVRFPKLAKAILAGHIDRTSMGVDVERSECSKCANVATTPLEYCRHIPGMKGTKIYQFTASGERKPHLVRERCYGLKFFENSLLVEEPADPTAYFLGKPHLAKAAAKETAVPTTLAPKVGMHRCSLCFSNDTLTMLGYVECGNCGSVGSVTAAGPRIPRDQRTPEQDRKSFIVAEHPDASTHPAWEHLGASSDNIVEHFNAASKSEHADGMRWYSDAELLAHHLGNSTGHGKGRASAVLAAMSPQMEWNINVHHAVRSLHTGQALGEGDGQNITASHQKKAQEIMDGPEDEETHAKILNGPKTQNFNHLIRHGGRDPVNGGHAQNVCVDVHAMSVACGKRLEGDDKKLGQTLLGKHHFYPHAERLYQDAARRLSEQHGYEIAPHQVQAVTWGVRKRRNMEADPDSRQTKALTTQERNNNVRKRDAYGDTGMGAPPESSDPEMPNLHARRSRRPFGERRAYGETKAPADVDTLRDEECPICGESTSYDGNTCSVCGFVQPPKEFQDPDLELAQKLDLRKDDADPNGMDVSDVQGVEDSINDANRDGLDDSTGMPMEQGGDPEMGQDPDLVCPLCGEGFSSKPTSVSMENPLADSVGTDDPEQAESDAETKGVEDDGNAAEGDPCPNCGKGILEPPGQAQAEMGEDPEMAAEEGAPGGEGEPTTDPEADPDDLKDSPEADPEEEGGNPFGGEDEGDKARDEERSEEGDEEPEDDFDHDTHEQFGEEGGDSDEEPEDDEDEERPAGHTPWKR